MKDPRGFDDIASSYGPNHSRHCSFAHDQSISASDFVAGRAFKSRLSWMV